MRILILSTVLLSTAFAYADQVASPGASRPGAYSAPVSSDPLPPLALERMRAIQDQPLPSGINCFGTVLWTLGFTEGLKPATKVEILTFLGSRACRKLKPGEPVRRGDVGSVYTLMNGIEHSYVVLDDNTLFEKASFQAKDRPQMLSVNVKFPELKDISSGCKFQSKGVCVSGVVNYRCDKNAIAEFREELNTTFATDRQKVKFLLQAVDDACRDGSENACRDAFERYLINTQALLSDTSKQLLAAESMDGLILFLGMHNDKIQQLPHEDLLAFLRLNNRFAAGENSTPRELADFPDGSL
jgi:hypothetical protein